MSGSDQWERKVVRDGEVEREREFMRNDTLICVSVALVAILRQVPSSVETNKNGVVERRTWTSCPTASLVLTPGALHLNFESSLV
jgi:hypothetical protein